MACATFKCETQNSHHTKNWKVQKNKFNKYLVSLRQKGIQRTNSAEKNLVTLILIIVYKLQYQLIMH